MTMLTMKVLTCQVQIKQNSNKQGNITKSSSNEEINIIYKEKLNQFITQKRKILPEVLLDWPDD